MMAVLWIGLAVSTLISEDAACITAGMLVQRGDLSMAAGVISCAVGILAGDVGLWALGRFGQQRLSRFAWIARRLEAARALVHHDPRVQEAAPLAIVSSRFLPGTRLPLYVGAGLAGVPLGVFARWSALAVAVWTPLLVLGSAGIGDILTPGLARATLFDGRRAAAGLGLAAVFAIGRVLSDPQGRDRVMARLSRLWRWEFWPMWLFYPPVVLWIGWLALRHGGLATMTAANPGIADGGTVGESKADILARLPADSVVPFRLVRASTAADRVRAVQQIIAETGWAFPVILKPDVGERGAGVKMIRSFADAVPYCAAGDWPFLVQPYHPGPFEAGVFYYRHPGAPNGRILSITDKRFPVVSGDGHATLEELVWAHPRYRMQARTFLSRHASQASRVLGAGESYRLAVAGNHSKGTMFLDGEHLRSEALERRIDEIARAYDGFFIGRFDIRYADGEAFRAGRDIAIIELNGATAEPTDLYDPRGSLWSAYRKLFTQWSLVFQIGAANRDRGAATTPIRRLAALACAHVKAPALQAD